MFLPQASPREKCRSLRVDDEVRYALLSTPERARQFGDLEASQPARWCMLQLSLFKGEEPDL